MLYALTNAKDDSLIAIVDGEMDKSEMRRLAREKIGWLDSSIVLSLEPINVERVEALRDKWIDEEADEREWAETENELRRLR